MINAVRLATKIKKIITAQRLYGNEWWCLLLLAMLKVTLTGVYRDLPAVKNVSVRQQGLVDQGYGWLRAIIPSSEPYSHLMWAQN